MIGAVLAALMMVPGAGEAMTASPALSLPDQQRLSRALDAWTSAMARGDTDAALAAVNAMDTIRLPPRTRALLIQLRGLALLKGGKGVEADAAFGEAEAISPTDGNVLTYRLGISLRAKPPDLGRSVALIERIAREHPDSALAVPVETIRYLNQHLWQAKREADVDRIFVALGRIGYGGANVAVRDSYAVGAAETLLKQGSVGEAAVLASRVVSLDRLEWMLTDRAYEPLWPALEQSVGPGYATARVRAAEAASAYLAAEPDSPIAIQFAIETATLLGRYDEADRIGRHFAATPDEVARLDERGSWVVNAHAGALFEAGRYDQADRRFAMLADLEPAAYPWVVNTVLNRIGLLIEAGRFRQALALLPTADRVVSGYGSPYAAQLVREIEIRCLIDAGRRSEADAKLPDLMAHAADGRLSTVFALAAAGHQDEAARQLIAAFENKAWRTRAITLFQPPGFTGSKTIARSRDMQQLLACSDVRAAFDRVGRVLPKSLSAS